MTRWAKVLLGDLVRLVLANARVGRKDRLAHAVRLFKRGARQPHLRLSDSQHEALGKQGHNEQRNTDHYRSIPRRL